MADDQVIGVLQFRLDEEDGVMVVPFGGDEGIRINRAVPPDPWILLVLGLFSEAWREKGQEY
jgi:hypothetical protein